MIQKFRDPKDGSFSMRKFREFGLIWICWLGMLLLLHALWRVAVTRGVISIEGWVLFGAIATGNSVIYSWFRAKDKGCESKIRRP